MPNDAQKTLLEGLHRLRTWVVVAARDHQTIDLGDLIRDLDDLHELADRVAVERAAVNLEVRETADQVDTGPRALLLFRLDYIDAVLAQALEAGDITVADAVPLMLQVYEHRAQLGRA